MALESPQDVLLKVEDLKKYFPIEEGFLRRVTGKVRAVDGISFSIPSGESMGLVGESGCGKTTTAKLILRAIEPTSGNILFEKENGEVVDISDLNKKELSEIRKEIQMIFQDPQSSLNPRMPVLDIVAEPMIAQGRKRSDCIERVKELLELVGMDPGYVNRYPHAFSGGQRQRIGIARALSISPSLIVADEPVSALDVSVQAQILNLLDDLQDNFELTYLFIAHDLSVIRYIADFVAVMYVGNLVEVASTKELFNSPLHPYTSALLGAVPSADPAQEWTFQTLPGEVADPSQEIQGCTFSPRCPYSNPLCERKVPELVKFSKSEGRRRVACHRYDELELSGV